MKHLAAALILLSFVLATTAYADGGDDIQLCTGQHCIAVPADGGD